MSILNIDGVYIIVLLLWWHIVLLQWWHIAELLVPWPLLASHVTVHSYYHLIVNFN